MAGMAAAAAGSGGVPGARVDWRLAAPLGLTYLAFFAAPFAILLGISFYADAEQTRLGLDSWAKFYGDAFYRKVIFDTLKLGVFAVLATTLLAYPLALAGVLRKKLAWLDTQLAATPAAGTVPGGTAGNWHTTVAFWSAVPGAAWMLRALPSRKSSSSASLAVAGWHATPAWM